jgi:hypothetical protein
MRRLSKAGEDENDTGLPLSELQPENVAIAAGEVIGSKDCAVFPEPAAPGVPTNTRTTAYFYADGRDLQSAVDNAVYNGVAPLPLFMNTSYATAEQRLIAEQSNALLIEIIRAESGCFDSSTTPLGRTAPEFPKIAPCVCAISIPPYAGKFSGNINILLAREPNANERAELRDAASALASDIFDHEIRG